MANGGIESAVFATNFDEFYPFRLYGYELLKDAGVEFHVLEGFHDELLVRPDSMIQEAKNLIKDY
jgi:hypothetical protein